ncbi:STAS domain-containing protein [Streptomyces shenzhenensis]|uniref:STAS domain-containing protein n=1 Tax=Streptomyces shenzhenensis TaxID=943815 RepID=UPI00217D617C|nr:STAS domain-containing protein [Streptomyces shenzhenensis]
MLVLTGPVARDEVTGHCDDLRGLLEVTGLGIVIVDVAGLGPPGLWAVELLARLELTARRAGVRIRLRNAGPALRALLDLVGLRFQLERQAEQGEPASGVEEAVQTADPAL